MSSQFFSHGKSTDLILSHGDIEPRMPYLKKIIKYQPDSRIEVGYTLDLDEDLYLNHHALIHAPGIKEPCECLPILPMAFGLEIMAQAAACLAPGLGIIGFKNVTASQWVGMKDATTLPIRLSARLETENLQQMTRTVIVELFKEDDAFPAMKCNVILGKHYLLNIMLTFEELIAPMPLPVTVEQLYRERFLFHGSLLHCISRIHSIGENGLIGEVWLFDTQNFFKSTPNPVLLTHPSFMDGVAQLMVAWLMNKEYKALPIGIGTVEIYRPTPKTKQSLPVYLQIAEKKYKTISVNLEVHDGKGNVWMRIKSWKYVIFHHQQSLSDFLRLPDQFHASNELFSSTGGTVGREISRNALRNMDLEWVSRTLLHTTEMPRFNGLKETTEKQAWLLERLVSKDAVRHFLASETSSKSVHPANFYLKKDKDNLFTTHYPSEKNSMPRVMTTTKGDHTIAIAFKNNSAIPLEILKKNLKNLINQGNETSRVAEITNTN